MAFGAEMLYPPAVAELGQQLQGGHRDAEVNPILGTEELMERRQLALELFEMRRDQRCGRAGEQHHDDHHPPAEEPAGVLIEPVEEPLEINAAKTEGKNIGELAHQL